MTYFLGSEDSLNPRGKRYWSLCVFSYTQSHQKSLQSSSYGKTLQGVSGYIANGDVFPSFYVYTDEKSRFTETPGVRGSTFPPSISRRK